MAGSMQPCEGQVSGELMASGQQMFRKAKLCHLVSCRQTASGSSSSAGR